MKNKIKQICDKYLKDYSIKSKKVSFGGFGYGTAQFFKVKFAGIAPAGLDQELKEFAKSHNDSIDLQFNPKLVIVFE